MPDIILFFSNENCLQFKNLGVISKTTIKTEMVRHGGIHAADSGNKKEAKDG
jgi:hypothetical protein